MKRREFFQLSAVALGSLGLRKASAEPKTARPNILWIVAEDASPHLGCYGETAIKTPHLDALAGEGVRFENAFVTCPVCSPCRSALATGMYQTTLGAHNHRSQKDSGKAGGNRAFYDSYQLPEATPLLSDLFRAAGYYTCNGAGPTASKPGKTDYNFITRTPLYGGSDWRKAPKGKPFFAQIQLHGGKSRPKDFKAGSFTLPPYYPDDAVLQQDWAEYLGSWEKQDREVGQIIQSLKEAGVYDKTLVIFITDHGISHVRGKQFLYEEGIRVPLIVRFPDGRRAGQVRTDLALQIDLGPVSLAEAGIPIPGHLQGDDLFAANYQPRKFIVSARDRCDETIEIIRCLRTPKYKYIRNFMSYRPHLQFNQYKDGKNITKRMRQLHAEGKLTPLQDQIFNPTRPPEELYDLEADPHETINLAGKSEHKERLAGFRQELYDWMLESGDPGLIPEPILEDLGRKHGSKYAAMQDPAVRTLIPKLIKVIEAGEARDLKTLHTALTDTDPSVRYWAAVWLGHLEDKTAQAQLETVMDNAVPVVQVAAALALCKLGHTEQYLPRLVELIDNENLLVGMYAMNAIEQTGLLNKTVEQAARKASVSRYEFTRRYGKRLRKMCIQNQG